MARYLVRRWLLRLFAGLGVLIALVVVAAVVALHSLDRPWLKRRLQAFTRDAAGVEIDFRSVRLAALSGAEIEDFVLRAPPQFRVFAPELIHVGRVAVRWSLASWLHGRGPAIEGITVSDVDVTVVVDEHGRTSFDALSSSGSKPAKPASVPLSRKVGLLLDTPLPLGELTVQRVTLHLLRTAQAEVFDRMQLRGVSIALGTRTATPPARGFRVQAGLGTRTRPLELELSRLWAGARASARAKLWLAAQVTSSDVHIELDLRMIEQSFVASLAANHWLHGAAKVHFNPAAGRTEITIDHVQAGDGAARVDATLEVSDSLDPVVRHAHADLDLARLLRWLPAGVVPFTTERARLSGDMDALALGPAVGLAKNGALSVEAELANLTISAPSAPLALRDAKLSLRAWPGHDGSIAGKGSLTLARVALGSEAGRIAADDVRCDVDAMQRSDSVLEGQIDVHFARVELGRANVAHTGRVTLHAHDLHFDASALGTTRGDVALSLALGSLDAHADAGHALADALELRLHSALTGQAPYSAELELRASRLQLEDGARGVLVDAPVRVDAHVREVTPEGEHPTASRGVVHVTVELGDTHVSFDATKHKDALEFALGATVRSLKAVRPFLPRVPTDQAAWDRMAVSLHSHGHLEHLNSANPALRAQTEIDMDHPAFDELAARSLSLVLGAQGTAQQPKVELDLRASALSIGGGVSSDDHVTLWASLDRKRPSLQWRLATEGRATTKLSGAFSFDATRRALACDVEGTLAGLAPLSPFAAKLRALAAFDLSQLEVGVAAHGALLGVFAAVTRDGKWTLEPDPLHSARVEGAAQLHLAHFRWHKGELSIGAPDLTWHGDMQNAVERRVLDSHFEIGTLHLGVGSHTIDVNGISAKTKLAVLGSLVAPELELDQQLAIRAVEQTLVPEYPLGDLAFAIRADRGPDAVVHIAELKIANGLGGTEVAVSGNVDLGEGRRTLSVTTTLAQDLAPLSAIPERLLGRGKLAIEANVTSPDFTHYHLRAAVKGEAVHLKLARAGIELENANGEVPITVALELSRGGLSLERSHNRNPYSMLRFADQLPLLRRSGFLSITRLQTPFVSIAPLVGNLEIEQNLFSLRQFEMGVRGGSITGQCGLDWNGPKSTLELHVRAAGVQSSHAEPFDGNIAVAISAADRTIDGRAEILRIGERHLLDLLDLQDPLHVDPALNRIRSALDFGYPDSLRLVFDHGFASAHLELGGLAQFVSIGELRGIPMGPIVDKLLAQMMGGQDLKEMP